MITVPPYQGQQRPTMIITSLGDGLFVNHNLIHIASNELGTIKRTDSQPQLILRRLLYSLVYSFRMSVTRSSVARRPSPCMVVRYLRVPMNLFSFQFLLRRRDVSKRGSGDFAKLYLIFSVPPSLLLWRYYCQPVTNIMLLSNDPATASLM